MHASEALKIVSVFLDLGWRKRDESLKSHMDVVNLAGVYYMLQNTIKSLFVGVRNPRFAQ